MYWQVLGTRLIKPRIEYGGQLFDLLWLLAGAARQRKLDGAPDMVAGRVFGVKSYAPRESQTIERNPQARRARSFSYDGKTIEMWQHLKIGAKILKIVPCVFISVGMLSLAGGDRSLR